MRASPINTVIDHVRRVMLPDGAGLSDGELLGSFIERRDEIALAALAKRHGPMVWGVCRRMLGHHDAQDAFQATFLVLVRKAPTIRSREKVGSWLYGVAYQTALLARRTATRRQAREVQVTTMPDSEAGQPDQWPELRSLLDEELSRLPKLYRVVVVLCDLEGRTRKEVARQLELPEGTVGGRLARARSLLAKRLTQRGVVLSGGALAALLSADSGSASAPPSLVASTIKAASLMAAGQATAIVSVKVAALTEGLVQAMFVSKIKSVLAVLLVVLACVGGVIVAGKLIAASQQPTSTANQDDPGKEPDADKSGRSALGLFRRMEDELARARTIECVFEGKLQPKGSLKGLLAFAEGNKVRTEYSLETETGRQITCTVVSDGVKVVNVLNGKEPEQVFEPSTKDVPLNPQSHREMLIRSFGLAGGCTVLELSSFELRVSGFKLGKKEKVDGRDTQIIEYEMTVEGAGAFISTAVWLDAKTALPIKRVVNIDKGAVEKYTVAETYTDLTLNKSIDAKRFELPK